MSHEVESIKLKTMQFFFRVMLNANAATKTNETTLSKYLCIQLRKLFYLYILIF